VLTLATAAASSGVSISTCSAQSEHHSGIADACGLLTMSTSWVSLVMIVLFLVSTLISVGFGIVNENDQLIARTFALTVECCESSVALRAAFYRQSACLSLTSALIRD